MENYPQDLLYSLIANTSLLQILFVPSLYRISKFSSSTTLTNMLSKTSIAVAIVTMGLAGVRAFDPTEDDLCLLDSAKDVTKSRKVDYTAPIQSDWPAHWKDIIGWNCELMNSTISGQLNSTTYSLPSLPTPTGVQSTALTSTMLVSTTDSTFTTESPPTPTGDEFTTTAPITDSTPTESPPTPTGGESTTLVPTTDSASMTESIPTPTGDESTTLAPTNDSTSTVETLPTPTGDESTTLITVTLTSTTDPISTAGPARH
ncbi:hypothetical protein BCR34DRAFT_597386 [Clohesyomyces aquaticus]|uniref:Uncharacterized protein n=1 Tax=Clohesyomyces aquaticus TaxID=1231657 RepID=A0A1Y2A3A4_9PLEO|nr:hypothetical protein BCR34DRAFT_597386 [Clohesyomyces aquaticus]